MKAPSFARFRWPDVAGAFRQKGGDRLELWLPRDWPGNDAELRWRRTDARGVVREGKGTNWIWHRPQPLIDAPGLQALNSTDEGAEPQ